jgi:hypothetical protein
VAPAAVAGLEALTRVAVMEVPEALVLWAAAGVVVVVAARWP